jgi:CRISPR-associated endonuclease/helicase Cas3
MTNAAIYNARIVIDEIHIYDGYTLGILLKVLELTKPYDTQFAIMSASLPIVLQEEIEKVLPKETFTFIKDQLLDEKQRHVLETRNFDVLYTENAPIDAIIQRLGRVNRKGEIQIRTGEKFAKVVISEASKTARNYIYSPTILDNTFDLLTNFINKLDGNLREKHLKEIINQVYKNENIPQSYWDDMQEGRTLIEKVWKECTKNIYTLSMSDKQAEYIFTRKSTYLTIECILLKHFEKNDFATWIENFEFDRIREYTVKVPIYLARKNRIPSTLFEESDLWLIKPSYDYLRGISWDSEDFGIC